MVSNELVFEQCLAELISYCDRKADAKAVACRLIETIGHGAIFRSSSLEELASVEGGSANVAMMLRLISSLMSRRVTDRVTVGRKYTDYDIERYLVGAYIGCSVETVRMLSFDARDRLIAVDVVGEGTVVSSDTYPRKLLELALRRGAHRVILAHNHPGGAALPSEQDLSATARLYNVLLSGGVILSAHCIVADFGIYRIDPSDEALFNTPTDIGRGV